MFAMTASLLQPLNWSMLPNGALLVVQEDNNKVLKEAPIHVNTRQTEHPEVPKPKVVMVTAAATQTLAAKIVAPLNV